MESDSEGFKYPAVNSSLCINCGLCEKVCPIINPKSTAKDSEPTAYAAFNKSEDIRRKSSSGGVFTLLAESIISKGGVVFGAAFDECFEVKHIAVEKIEDLEKLRGSKYVQSDIEDSLRFTKEYLENGRYVLFTGTPCQIAGLKSYLGKDYERLICQDIICHGVPSPLAWEKYKDHRKKRDAEDTLSISFRDKKDGWKAYCVHFEHPEASYCKTFSQDLYMQAFLKNLCLRPSCYECAFKTLDRDSDITLADFWGVQNVHPEMDDDKGISLVLLHSKKGRELFEEIMHQLSFQSTDIHNAIKYNSSAVRSSSRNPQRDKFIKDIKNSDFELVVKKYTKTPFSTRLKRFIKRILSKIIK